MSRLDPRIAVYTGTFDPIHRGHLDVITRAAQLYDQLIVGIGVNPDKKTLFDIDERVALARTVTAEFANVRVESFDGLTVRFVRSTNARVMVRGLRTLSDMEYEFTMSLMNSHLDNEIETVFLMAHEEFSHVSSSLLRQIAVLGGNTIKFLPEPVALALAEKARG